MTDCYQQQLKNRDRQLLLAQLNEKKREETGMKIKETTREDMTAEGRKKKQGEEKKRGDQVLGQIRRAVPPAPSATDFSKRQAKIIRLYYWLVVDFITSHHLPECRS